HGDAVAQAFDQEIGLLVALDHCFNLLVTPFKLLILLAILRAEKGVLAFELGNVAIISRVRPRLFAHCSHGSILIGALSAAIPMPRGWEGSSRPTRILWSPGAACRIPGP